MAVLPTGTAFIEPDSPCENPLGGRSPTEARPPASNSAIAPLDAGDSLP